MIEKENSNEDIELLVANEEPCEEINMLRLPIWHSDENRDTLTAKQWVAYVQTAKEFFNWTDEVTMKCVANALMGQALSWFYQLVGLLFFCIFI